MTEPMSTERITHKELRELADEGSLDAVRETAKELEDMFEGNVSFPDFEFPG